MRQRCVRERAESRLTLVLCLTNVVSAPVYEGHAFTWECLKPSPNLNYWWRAPQTIILPGPHPYSSYYNHRLDFTKKPSRNFEEQDLLLKSPVEHPACLRATQWWHRGRETDGGEGPDTLPLIGYKGEKFAVSGLTHSWLIWSTGVRIRAWESGHRVAQAVSHVGHPGFSERGTPWVVEAYLLTLSHSWWYIYSRECLLQRMPQHWKV